MSATQRRPYAQPQFPQWPGDAAAAAALGLGGAAVSVSYGNLLPRLFVGKVTPWFPVEEHSPSKSGFYQIKDQDCGVFFAWYDKDKGAFQHLLIDDRKVWPPTMKWRGVLESVGKIRRVLLE